MPELPRDPATGRAAAIESGVRRWPKRLAYAAFCLAIIAVTAYFARTTLMISVVRLMLDRDPALVIQERKDGVTIALGQTPPAWTTPLKNLMNEIWQPAKVEGVNYYTFAGPGNWFQSYSERSNPRSPFYQAWFGAYVIHEPDGTQPADLQQLVSELTVLDQRSWLEAMGDPKPMAESGDLTSAGTIMIDGSSWPLWHDSYRTHSDLSAQPQTQLATLLGMPAATLWPASLKPFHDVTLDGYLAARFDQERKVTILIYAVSASYPGQSAALTGGLPISRDDLLQLMSRVKVVAVR